MQLKVEHGSSSRLGVHDISEQSEGTVHSRTVETMNKQEISASASISETSTSSTPDFSILNREIPLNDLSVGELQEVFHVTFGRKISIDDKLWLKRRIVMGLTNSYEVPTTNIRIKDNKVFHMDREEIYLENDVKNENFHMDEQNASKRARKPTKRYIEELSDVEGRESSGRLVSCLRELRPRQVSPRPATANLIDIKIPHVCRRIRRQPRKDFDALMKFGGLERKLFAVDGSEGEKTLVESFYGEEKCPDNVNITTPVVDSSNYNGDSMSDKDVKTSKSNTKRKHHRTWTLAEVLKLVEGVSRYGAGKWSVIRQSSFASDSYRTPVDLKDKWRNLIKASFSVELSDSGLKSLRKPNSAVPIPTPVLLKVRELAEMQSPQGVEFIPIKYVTHSGNLVQEKGSGFL